MADARIVGVAVDGCDDRAIEAAVAAACLLADFEGRPHPDIWRFSYRHDMLLGGERTVVVRAEGVDQPS